jgi:hypothetical protein
MIYKDVEEPAVPIVQTPKPTQGDAAVLANEALTRKLAAETEGAIVAAGQAAPLTAKQRMDARIAELKAIKAAKEAGL